ncbi:undecaprenyl/decaprenyl-phosphate alpha-N-acetylglucosaminyl 1-phosphate transferase [Candidatus Uhrbacteria bacterium]|nr:undecaprenyl/decaprenyl-phosphate alpha-N-acetylglucosaminyl 1-phosphate transferase [Candidatus Uhrbacteria bacterium]
MNQPLFWMMAAALPAGAVFLFAYIVQRFAYGAKIVDEPSGGRKIHQKTTALLGGWAVGIPLLILIAGLDWFGIFFELSNGRLQPLQISGILGGVCLLLLGGGLDDRYNLKPLVQICFPLSASILVALTGTRISHVTNPLDGTPFILPFQTLLTIAWLLGVTYATKLMDGIDGLVAGQTVIGSSVIAALALSAAYFQPAVALIALMTASAFAGFLPHNVHPAKQFLGESGSTLAGFLLGTLSILGSTKLATGLMALALPLTDAAIVISGRVMRGSSPFKGDDTHLHFKLLKAGFSQRQVVSLMWGLSLACGIAALSLQTRGKLFLIVFLLLVTAGLSFMAGKKSFTKTSL